MPSMSTSDSGKCRSGTTQKHNEPSNAERCSTGRPSNSLGESRFFKVIRFTGRNPVVSVLAAFPLIALALYLYWLTLPEYEPTGNEVYDAFAPVAYEIYLLNTVGWKLSLCGISGSGYKQQRMRIVETISKMIFDLLPADFNVTSKLEKMPAEVKNTADYISIKWIFDNAEPPINKVGDEYSTEKYDAGAFLVALSYNKSFYKEDLIKTAELRYPEYSLWYFMEAEQDLSKPHAQIESFLRGFSQINETELNSYFNESGKAIKEALSAPNNDSPSYFPYDMAFQELQCNDNLVNIRVARSCCEWNRQYFRISLHNYEHIIVAYELGYIDIDFLDEYLKYINKWLLYNEKIVFPSKYRRLKTYVNLLEELESNTVTLTDMQEQELDKYKQEIMRISSFVSNGMRVVNPLFTDDKGWRTRLIEMKKFNKYIPSELSKLDPPTIEEWLAGGATLKPRQGSASAQGASTSQSSGSQSQSGTAQQNGTGNTQTTP